jgi:hypothetical protein
MQTWPEVEVVGVLGDVVVGFEDVQAVDGQYPWEQVNAQSPA